MSFYAAQPVTLNFKPETKKLLHFTIPYGIAYKGRGSAFIG